MIKIVAFTQFCIVVVIDTIDPALYSLNFRSPLASRKALSASTISA
jgi:hypothetical protein